ncbi:alpha/beta fold hydrolase [Sporosarcina sp. CAU 1771]
MRELTLNMSDGFLLHGFIVRPEGNPVGHVHILHGMAEHSGRYVQFTQNLVKNGYIVSGHDHRGHGKTSELNGTKGYFAEKNGFNRVVEDAFKVMAQLKEENPSPKFILFGHSMGSFIGRRLIQKHGEIIDLAVFSGTGGDPGISRQGGKAAAYLMGKSKGFDQPNEFLDSLVFGSFNKKIKNPATKFDWLSNDPLAVASYMHDENCGFIATTQFFADLFEGLGIIHKKSEIAKIPTTLPILLFSGAMDPVGEYGKAIWKVAKGYTDAGIEDVTVLLYENGRHELLNDTKSEEVTEAILDWIKKR